MQELCSRLGFFFARCNRAGSQYPTLIREFVDSDGDAQQESFSIRISDHNSSPLSENTHDFELRFEQDNAHQWALIEAKAQQIASL